MLFLLPYLFKYKAELIERIMSKIEQAKSILAEKNLSPLEFKISWIRGWDDAIIYANSLGVTPAFLEKIDNALMILMLLKLKDWAFPKEVTEKVLSHRLIQDEISKMEATAPQLNLLYAMMILINHSYTFNEITLKYLKENLEVVEVILNCDRFGIYTWLDAFFIPNSLLASNLYFLLDSKISEDVVKQALGNYPLVEALKSYSIQTISAFNAYSILCYFNIFLEKQITTDDETLILTAYYYRMYDERYQKNNKVVFQKIVDEPDFVQSLMSCEPAQKEAVFAAVRFNRNAEDIEFCRQYKSLGLSQMLLLSNDERAAAYAINLNKKIHQLTVKMKYFGENHDAKAGSACLRVIMHLNEVINKYFGEGNEVHLLHNDPITDFKKEILDVLEAEKAILDAHRGVMGYLDGAINIPKAWVSPETQEIYWGTEQHFFQTNTGQTLKEIKDLTNELTEFTDQPSPPQ